MKRGRNKTKIHREEPDWGERERELYNKIYTDDRIKGHRHIMAEICRIIRFEKKLWKQMGKK